MSESPASKMAMVEQRNSLPQAVPSSICKYEKKVVVSQCFLPSKAQDGMAFSQGGIPEQERTCWVP